jgi:hypothetical protein
MKQRIVLLALGAVLTLTACSSMRFASDHDPDAVNRMQEYRTYDWLPTEGNVVVDASRATSEFLPKRIKHTIDDQLASNGYQLAAGGGADFLVGYHVSTAGKLDATTVNTYYGYGYGWGGWYAPAMATNTYVHEYTEGTLLIDVVDAQANELVWRGTAQAEVSETDSPQQTNQKIAAAVEGILARFPPTE